MAPLPDSGRLNRRRIQGIRLALEPEDRNRGRVGVLSSVSLRLCGDASLFPIRSRGKAVRRGRVPILARRWPIPLTKHHQRGNLLIVLKDLSIEPTNNFAERILRPGVIAREVSHCSKTGCGAAACAAFMRHANPQPSSCAKCPRCSTHWPASSRRSPSLRGEPLHSPVCGVHPSPKSEKILPKERYH